MLIDIARFEFRYLLRNPLVWLTAAVTFAFSFVTISAGLEIGSEGGLLENAAFATLRNYMLVSIFYMFVTTAFVANAVIRDDETGFGPIMRSTSITRLDYLIGRFIGAFTIAALCLMLIPIGIWLGTLMPWADPQTIGPNRLADHVYAYFVIALPNILIHSAIFFALATITRSMMGTYLGIVALCLRLFYPPGRVRGQAAAPDGHRDRRSIRLAAARRCYPLLDCRRAECEAAGICGVAAVQPVSLDQHRVSVSRTRVLRVSVRRAGDIEA